MRGVVPTRCGRMGAGMDEPRRLPLRDLHVELGARFVPFAGWEMPVQYPAGVMAEHLHCRAAAALFDVSHMGQVVLRGAQADRALEALVPADLLGLPEGRQRYGLLTSAAGGILDDLMVARLGGALHLVVNASRVGTDLAHLRAQLPAAVVPDPVEGRALLALQGPGSEAALATVLPGVTAMRFMDAARMDWQGATLWLTRSGYTGEDGFEISAPAAQAEALARELLARPGVAPAGLGARDSLRLEAGLPLWGQDMDETVTPAEAGLGWAVARARRPGGARPGGFPGAARVLAELADGPARRRVGLLPEGRAPMRAGVELFADPEGGESVGRIGSGGFAPSLDRPAATALLPIRLCDPGTRVYGALRGRRLPLAVAALPFRPANYRKGP
jgi:aminomethyltransferase